MKEKKLKNKMSKKRMQKLQTIAPKSLWFFEKSQPYCTQLDPMQHFPPHFLYTKQLSQICKKN